MKSAYIITMHCPLNYGAILQTYALQTYIESLGIHVRVINYRPDYIVCYQSLMYVGSNQYNRNLLSRWIYRIIKAPSRFIRKGRFINFARQELHLTPEFKTFNDIKNAGLEADYFICGSDQIWNVVSGAHKDPAYFLEFVLDKNKRISYAASGNLPLTEEVKTVTIPMINNIAHLSMRESMTISSIQQFINKPIVHVCDPVFLLNCEVWRELYRSHTKHFHHGKYVLVYPMAKGGDTTIAKAYFLSKQLGYPLYMISASQRRDSRIDKRFNVDPYTFLSLVDNAEYVVTNSFHGTSFSIIFEKQFWSCIAEGTNQRLTNILCLASLENRLLTDDSLPIIDEVVDFKMAKYNLSNYISQSKEFIESVCE